MTKAMQSTRATLRRHWLAFSVVAMLTASAVHAQNAVGGDSIEVGGRTYRLYGVEAPDPAQVCADGWPAGHAAVQYLNALIGGRQISCVPIVGTEAGDVNAICRADSVDVGAAMVTGGYAYADVPFSARYIAQEAAAASALRGVHGHDCVTPWEWRARLGEDR